eukprot:2029717-Prymnesium_polylepis.2
MKRAWARGAPCGRAGERQRSAACEMRVAGTTGDQTARGEGGRGDRGACGVRWACVCVLRVHGTWHAD